MDTLDTHLFGDNLYSFSRYLEPEAYSEMRGECSRPNIRSYRKRLPRTCYLAREMMMHLPQAWYWGVQITGGSWPQQRVGRLYPGYDGRMVSGRPMSTKDITKHLVGATYAVGNCDGEGGAWRERLDMWRLIHDTCAQEYRQVTVLRIDTDQDVPWRDRRIEPIAHQIQVEQKAAWTLGLDYNVFRTGNRGTQAVMPLPCAVTLPVASWLEIAFRRLVETRRHPSACVDKSNLTQVLRLPGGCHAKSCQLALWIDPMCMELYPMQQQMDLMAYGLLHWRDNPKNWVYQVEAMTDDPLPEFADAACEIEALLTEWGVGKGRLIDKDIFERVLSALPRNALVMRFRDTREVLSHDEGVERAAQTPEIAVDCSVVSAESETVDTLPAGTQYWALRVWMEAYKPGGSYRYWTARGGIRAAFILFGNREAALEALKQQAADMPPCTPEKTAERHYVLERLVARHRFLPPRQTPRAGEFTMEEQEWTSHILSRVNPRGKMYASRKLLTERLILVLLWKFRGHRDTGFQISYQTLAKAIQTAFGGDYPHRVDIQRAMKCLTAKTLDCRFGLVNIEHCFEAGWQMAIRYTAGTDLLNLWHSSM